MVRASEMSGSFAQMLDRIAAYIGQQLETRKMVHRGDDLPRRHRTMAVGVTDLPADLRAAQVRRGVRGQGRTSCPGRRTSSWACRTGWSQFWWIPLGGTVVVFIGSCSSRRRSSVVSGSIASSSRRRSSSACSASLYISRGLHTMGELLNAGVPMLDTLSITGDISGNRSTRTCGGAWHNASSRARSVAQPLQKTVAAAQGGRADDRGRRGVR
jgi:type IV pilus assembly protein PilC